MGGGAAVSAFLGAAFPARSVGEISKATSEILSAFDAFTCSRLSYLDQYIGIRKYCLELYAYNPSDFFC